VKHNFKRFLCLTLAFVMVFGLFPANVFATGEETTNVAQIGDTGYETLEAAFAAAADDDTIELLSDATPALTSQRAITKAAVIDLGDHTLTLAEDDLYFGTTTFMNGTIVVDPSVKASTAVFWMFEGQTLTFDKVEIVATGVTGTYLIGINGGTNSAVNLLNGSKITIANTEKADLTAVICDNGNGNNVVIENSEINVANIEGRFYLGGVSGNITVDDSAVVLNGVKEGFYLRANQTLAVEGTSDVAITLNDTNDRYGIHLSDTTAAYTKAETATVVSTDNVPEPVYAAMIGTQGYETLADAVAAAESGATITLMSGDHEMCVFQNKELTFVGENMETTTVTDYVAKGSQMHGVKVHFENLTVNGATENYYGLFHSAEVTYKNCNINGLRFLYAPEVSFESCAFNADGVEHSFWTYGASKITVTNCTFKYTDRAVNCYSESGASHETDIAFTGCTFTYAGTAAAPEGAVEINSGSSKSIDLTMNGCTAPEKGEMWFNSQWDSTKGANTTVEVDDTQVWPIHYVAKVGEIEYATIDEAIAAWTNGTTLTLLDHVTLSDVIQLSSTEYHVLDLGTYTMTAASKKDAIQIVNNGRSSASYALDIKADATNPGGITATGKAIVRTAGKSGVKDRPIIRFYNGVFNASNIVYHSGSNGTNCPQFYFYGGEFNGTIYTNRTLNQFYGGTFNGSLMMSVDSSAYSLISGGTFKQLSNMYMSALTSAKFTIGSAKGVYDREVYIDDNGYYVVAQTAPSEGYEASVSKTPGTNDYLKYSKVATEGKLNYTDVYTALKNNKTADVNVYVNELDMTGSSFEGTIVVPEGETITITVEAGTTPTWKVSSEDSVVYVDADGNALVKNEEGMFVKAPVMVYTKAELIAAVAAANAGDTIVLGADIDFGTDHLKIEKAITLDLGGKTLTTKARNYGLALYNGCTVTNGKLNHAGTVAAIKVWDAVEISDLEIDVTGTSASGNTIDGIVIQENAAGVDTIKNVTVHSTSGQGVDSGIKTYNCGNATEPVIGSMENVTVDAKSVGLNISAPCGTATNCSIKGGTNGIEIWIKGTYSASLDLVDCDVEGGVFAHDEFTSNPSVVNNGTLSLTVDEATTGVEVENVTLTLARAENVKGVVKEVKEAAQAKVNDTYYMTIEAAIKAAQPGDTVTILAGDYTTDVSVNKAITVVGETDADGNNLVNITGTLNITADGATVKNLNVNNGSSSAGYIGAKDVLVEGCTVVGGNGFRSCYTTGTVTFKDSTITGSTYGIHFDGSAGGNIVIDNCVITGWTSFAKTIKKVTMTDTKFEKGNYNYVRFYQEEVEITGCTFNEKMKVDLAVNGAKLTVTNSTVENGTVEGLFEGADIVNSTITVDGVKLSYVAKIGNTYYATLADAIAAVGAGDVVIELLTDATLDYNARDAYGTAETTSLTIKGNGKTLTLNQKNSDWASLGLANANAKLVLNNMTIEKTGYGDTSGAWNTHAIIFSCGVEMTDVTVNNGIAVQNGAALTNVTITEANGYYGLWINGNGQTVTVNGGSINATNGGRGIKIADQYIDAPASVTLSVTGTKFNTAKKAAVLVSSKAGADITASNVDIANVAEDTVNFVWVDEDWAADFGKVTVTGGTVAQESVESFNAVVMDGNKIVGYYKTLAEAVAVGGKVVLLKSIELTETIKVKGQVTLDLNGKTITGTDNATGSFALIEVQPGAELTVDDSVGGGKITLKATNDRDWNAYSSVISNQRGKLVVENGTIEHLGGTDMAYGIDNLTNGKGTYAETVINGGTIKSTYRGIRQFLNGVEAQNILTVNGGTIEGANKSIWMQDPNKNANTGSLTVGENAALKGDVYLYVTAGSATWPVEVSIASAALKDGSSVITGNVPYGYVVEENNGAWGVREAVYVAQIGEIGYESLAEALSAAEDGDVITLLWEEGDAPIAMNGSVSGKKVTITGTATVNWEKGFLFVGRTASGTAADATLIFKNANLTATPAGGDHGIHVSGA